MFKNIVVAVDGSDQSMRAVDAAIEMAKRFQAKLTTVCIYRHHSPLEASLSMVRAGSQQAETPDKALNDFAKDIARSAKERAIEAGIEEVEAFAKRGQPARAIVDFVKAHDADLVVIGARGNGDLEGFFLGSVSHKVTGLSPVPCLVIK